jgi:hypothetical protein
MLVMPYAFRRRRSCRDGYDVRKIPCDLRIVRIRAKAAGACHRTQRNGAFGTRTSLGLISAKKAVSAG